MRMMLVSPALVSIPWMALLQTFLRSHQTSSAFLHPTRVPLRYPHFIHQSLPCLRMTSSSVSSSSSRLLTGKMIVPLDDCLVVHGQNDVIFIDGSWFLTSIMKRNAREEFEKGPRIQGAKYFDIDDISTKDPTKNLPHMMPSKELFAATMDAMKITNNQHLIVYGTKGCFFVHRVWYQLKAMGHAPDLVHLMNGSLQDWIDRGGPIEESPTTVLRADDLDLSSSSVATRQYVARDAPNIVDFDQVLQTVQAYQSGSSGSSSNDGDDDESDGSASTKKTILVDARDPQRFNGWADEIRPGLKRGHAPGAKNVFFLNLLDPQTYQLKPVDELKTILTDAGVDITTEQRIVATCGSGVTACTIIAALEVCGRDPNQIWLYDGSWSEYGANDLDVPVDTVQEETNTN